MGVSGSRQRRFLFGSIAVFLLLWSISGLHVFGLMALGWSGIVVTGHVMARRGLEGLRVFRKVHPSAFEGDEVEVTLTLENRGSRSISAIELNSRFGPSLLDRLIVTERGPLPPSMRRRLTYVGSCTRRWGVYKVGPVAAAVSDPIGLFRHVVGFEEVDLFSVFPRVHEVPRLARHEGHRSLTPQENTRGQPGQSPLYLGVRDYRPGDERRRIHWPATARRGELTVKEYEIDLIPYFTLFLDLHRDHQAGTGRKSSLELIVRAGASLLWSAGQGRQLIQAFGEDGVALTVPPGRGRDHLTFALHRLIQVQQQGSTPLVELVTDQAAELPMGSTVALLFGTATPELDELERLDDLIRARRLDALFIFVASHTQTPVQRWAIPPEECEARMAQVAEFLDRRGFLHLVLDVETDMAQAFQQLGSLR